MECACIFLKEIFSKINFMLVITILGIYSEVFVNAHSSRKVLLLEAGWADVVCGSLFHGCPV